MLVTAFTGSGSYLPCVPVILRKNVSLLIILSVTILGTQIAVVNTKSVWILENKEQLVSNVNFAYQVRRWALSLIHI